MAAYPTFSEFVTPFNCDDDMIKWCQRIGISEKMFFDSLPSCGSGNHFLEYDENRDLNKYAVLVHCGSRNLGHRVFRYYKTIADQEKISKTEHAAIVARVKATNTDPKLLKQEIDRAKNEFSATRVPGYLKGDLLRSYMVDVLITQAYAMFNHLLIHKKVSHIYRSLCKANEAESIFSIHNYIDFDFPALDGSSHMMIRKGAIRSYKGEMMIIPFNMRDGVAICEGKSNPDWNFSAPHGAGRAMSRSKASSTIDLGLFQKQMSDAGIFTTTANKDTLDEAPDAYKSMDDIIRLIEPTAEIKYFLKPRMNIKASDGAPSWRKNK